MDYFNFKKRSIKSCNPKNDSSIIDKEMNILKLETSAAMEPFNDCETLNPDSDINLKVEYINFVDVLFENSISSVLLLNCEGRVQYVNACFEKVTGYTSKEIKGKSFTVLKCWDAEDNQHEVLWQTFGRGREWHGELKKKKKNGEFFWDYSIIYPVFGESKSITCYLVISEDITLIKEDQKRLKYDLQNPLEIYSLRTKFITTVTNELKLNVKIISDFVKIMQQFIKKDKYNHCNIYFKALYDYADRLLNGIENISKEDPSHFNMLQLCNIIKFLKDVQVPIKIMLRLLEYLKNEFMINNDLFLHGIFNIVCGLGCRALNITHLINDLSKEEEDEATYLTKVMKRIF
jgi:PAS domain S-box-containing protein